jgi:putative membrane-bound dehydrogenase-like protein
MPSLAGRLFPSSVSPLTKWLICGVLAAVLGTGTASFAQKPPQESIAAMSAADGFEIKLFATEPMVVNPIAIDVDTYGRVWVTEGTKYRRNVANPPDDKIKVLEDTDGDGVADKMTVFTSDLNAAMGICVAGSKIYVPESPNLYVYEDADNDLKPDGPRKTLLTGFGGQNHDHGLHSQVFGPDHKLYMTNGDSGYDVTGPDGRHIKFRWGGMIRCEADGTQLEDFAVNFRNPVELAVDSFGNVWCSDNDNDGLKSVRICWILEGGNYGWFGGPENIRNPDGSFDPIHHWRADKPGFVPYVLITGFGSPCGMTFYEHDAFGEKYRNKIIHCDAGPREIRCYSPERLKGVGYAAKQENIVTSSDGYFRPVDPCVAPDGAIFVTDWYDGGVGGHAYNDPTRGRIYRITPKGKNKKLDRIGKPGPFTNDADALAALASPNLATQFLARERLIASGEKVIKDLAAAVVFGRDEALSARALWLLDRIGGQGRDTVRDMMKQATPEFRALCIRILRRHGDAFLSDILSFIDDADGEVVKEVLLAVGASKSPKATIAVSNAFGRYTGSDRYLLETLGIASRGREADVFAAVVDRPNAPVNQRLIDIARVLRPEDATRYLASRLASPDLPAASATAVLSALASVATPEAGHSVAGVLTSSASVENKKLALESLRRNLGGPWSGLKVDPSFRNAIEKSLENKELTADTLNLIGEAGLADYAPSLGVILSSSESGAPAKLAAISVVSRLGIESAASQLAALLGSADTTVRDASLKALVTLRDTKTLVTLLTGRDNPKLKEQATDQLMTTSDGAVFILRLIDTKKIDKPLADRAIAAAVEHPDVNVRLLYEKFIPADKRPKTLGQSFKPEEILALQADAARGEQVFLRSGAASCNKCHRVKGKGADIGPDLSQIGRKYEKKALLETIMNPSAGIAPEYVPYVLETQAGKVYAGFLHDQNDERVVLKTIEGGDVQIARSQIVEMVKQEKSLMPELVLQSVTAQDAADLLAYLSSLQETIVHASTFRVLGPFNYVRPEQRVQDYGPEATAGNIDFSDAYELPNGKKELRWRTTTAAPGSSGIPEIDVRKVAAELKGRNENVIYYFAVTLDSATEQPGTLHIGSDDGIQVWLNGRKVHDAKVTRALVPGQDKVKVGFKQGKNLILLKLDQGNGAGGLTLSAEARANLVFGTP